MKKVMELSVKMAKSILGGKTNCTCKCGSCPSDELKAAKEQGNSIYSLGN